MRRFQQSRGERLQKQRRGVVCRALAGAALLCLVGIPMRAVRADDRSDREAAAQAAFDAAEMQRADLETTPEIARSLKDYTALVAAYRKVYLTTPLAVQDPAAINEVAALYRTMGDLFDEKYYRTAVDTYRFLLHEYPDNRYREDALLAVAHIEAENLRLPDLARSTCEEFVSLHPHSSHLAEVRAILASLDAHPAQPGKSARANPAPTPERAAGTASAPALSAASATAAPASAAAPGTMASQPGDPPAGEPPHAEAATEAGRHGEVSDIRTWNADTYTRVVIDVGSPVKYQASRISKPDRIYFDLEDSTLSASLLHKAVQVPNGGFVKDIRVAQNQPTMIRVVLDVTNAKDYSVFYLPHPDRLIVDVYGDRASQPLEVAAQNETLLGAATPAKASSSGEQAADTGSGTENTKDNRRAAQREGNAASAASQPTAASPQAGNQVANEPVRAPLVSASNTASNTAPKSLSSGTSGNQAGKPQTISSGSAQVGVSQAPTASALASVKAQEPAPPEAQAAASKAAATVASPASADADRLIAKASATAARSPFDAPDSGSLKAEAAPKVAPNETAGTASVATSTASAKHAKSESDSERETSALQPPSVPEPTRSGEQSLSRALGLKIGRIVIDPGHGGHDTGTIGPTGLMEKDLCLDVALRLGKLIKQRLPGAEVIYTRHDDTFIPLEQRTEIANEAHADLFLSIHANSSTVRSARGVETYYLNIDGTSSAMEVATRENALSANSVHDLQDLVAKIAQTDKIAESRDFAGDIQDSLSKRLENLRNEPDRGVRKAPFVVLIGADMPSVLAEISFLSNPGDEQWLKRGDNRERVAEGLYQGIETYLHSTNSLSVDKSPAHSSSATSAGAGHQGIVARAGNPQ